MIKFGPISGVLWGKKLMKINETDLCFGANIEKAEKPANQDLFIR